MDDGWRRLGHGSCRDHYLKSVEIKSAIVAQDAEEQSGIRKLLNLGHTAGHALESWALTEERDLLHGEAVAWGLAWPSPSVRRVTVTRTAP